MWQAVSLIGDNIAGLRTSRWRETGLFKCRFEKLSCKGAQWCFDGRLCKAARPLTSPFDRRYGAFQEVALTNCSHVDVRCLNHFELIRKYECLQCGAVMMCACDEGIGLKFLPHQLSEGSKFETHSRLLVTAGFQPKICRECRGLPPEAHPVAAIHGRTSKLKRYYWRELAFRKMELVAAWTDAQERQQIKIDATEEVKLQERAEKQALSEIKALHAATPKYTYDDETQESVLTRCSVQIINLDGTYLRCPADRKVQLLDGEEAISVEEYASRYFQRLGYSVLSLESRPFHVLFGVFMWLLIQDPGDPLNRVVGFGDRWAFERGELGQVIWTLLPEDFGTRGYAERRAVAIDKHLNSNMDNREELQWLFGYWLEPSKNLRQYLWAHKDEDVETARRLVAVLPAPFIMSLLRYLVADYWGRYLGWPDLLVYKGSDYRFVEVKSSGDKLSDDQKRWISDNHSLVNSPFVLFKIHKRKVVDVP